MAQKAKRAKSRGAVVRPEWDRETDKFEIRDAIEGRSIVVTGTLRSREEIFVRKVKSIGRYERQNGKLGPSTITFIDDHTGGFRSVRVVDVIEVR